MKLQAGTGYEQSQKLIKLVWRWDYLVLSRPESLEQGGGRRLPDSSTASKRQTSFLVLGCDELFKGDMWAPAEVSSAAPHPVTSGPSAQKKGHSHLGDQSPSFPHCSSWLCSEEAEGAVNEGGGGRKRQGILAQCESLWIKQHLAEASLARSLKRNQPSASVTPAFRDTSPWGEGRVATGNEMSRNEVWRVALTDRTAL